MLKGHNISHTAIAAGVVTVVGTAVAGYIYNEYIKKNKVPTEWEMVGTVETLYIYPLKSGRRIQVTEAEMTNKGLMEVGNYPGRLQLRDRAFVVYHAENFEYRSGRMIPKLVLISMEHWENDGVLLKAPGLPDLKLKIPKSTPDKIVTVTHLRNEKLRSIDCGDEAAKWVSTYILGKDTGYRLAYYDETFNRFQIKEAYSNTPYVKRDGLRNESAGINSDTTAVMLINKSSSTEILNAIGDPKVTIHYFRANIIVSGPNLQPFVEDNWKWIKIGDIVLKNVRECTRCILTLVNMETGERRQDREPIRTLEKFRRIGHNNETLMGIMLEVNHTGLISVGDAVYVGK